MSALTLISIAYRPFIPNLDEPTPASNQNEPYLDYYTYLLAQPNSALPQVITNSYGDDEQVNPSLMNIQMEALLTKHLCVDCAAELCHTRVQYDWAARCTWYLRS